MNDDDRDEQLSDDEVRQLDALLSDPALWDEPDPADEEFIVSAILAEASAAPAPTEPIDTSLPDNVVPISRHRRWVAPALSAAAAVLVVLLGLGIVNAIADRPVDGEVELALDGTDLAPAATATARIVDLPAGSRIRLDVEGLEPAAPGTYYEVWLRQDAEIGVSAGTFHLRGDGDIELWAGVSLQDYPLVTITIQEEAEPVSSGRVVLKALASEG
jgi:hypothetical protein